MLLNELTELLVLFGLLAELNIWLGDFSLLPLSLDTVNLDPPFAEGGPVVGLFAVNLPF